MHKHSKEAVRGEMDWTEASPRQGALLDHAEKKEIIESPES